MNAEHRRRRQRFVRAGRAARICPGRASQPQHTRPLAGWTRKDARTDERQWLDILPRRMEGVPLVYAK